MTFDLVSHDVYVEKLRCLGMDVSMLEWINVFLRNRTIVGVRIIEVPYTCIATRVK